MEKELTKLETYEKEHGEVMAGLNRLNQQAVELNQAIQKTTSRAIFLQGAIEALKPEPKIGVIK